MYVHVHIVPFGSSPRITGLFRGLAMKVPFAIHTCELVFFFQAGHTHSYSQYRLGCPHCGLSSNYTFPKSQHPYCTQQGLVESNIRLRFSGEAFRFSTVTYLEEWQNSSSVSLNSKLNQFVNKRFSLLVVNPRYVF